MDALRIERAHHVLDRAVLAPGVHCLEDDQQGFVLLGIQHFLKRMEPLQVGLGLIVGIVLVLEIPAIVRVEIFELKPLAGGKRVGLRHAGGCLLSTKKKVTVFSGGACGPPALP